MEIYHERQSFMFCAIHTLNNLFQGKEFTKQKLDEICNNLSPDQFVNPHKSVLGIGNYDVNCVMQALDSKNMQLIWFDKRKEITREDLELDRAFAFILNIPSDYTFGFIKLPIKSRHWISIKQINCDFYNLDSKLDKPLLIGDTDQLIDYLKTEMKSNDKELFIVVPKS